MAEPQPKNYYCHECGQSFTATFSVDAAPHCSSCGSEFIELLDSNESFLGDGTNSVPRTSTNPPNTSTSGPSTSTVTPSTSSQTSTATIITTRSTPINITIGPNPIFRRGLGMPFTVGGGGTERRESPMETDGGEDPGDEVINIRRSTGQTRTGNASDPSYGVFPGGMFVVRSSRSGHHQSLGEMIHQHISNVMAQRDGGQQQQQEAQGATPETSSVQGGARNNRPPGSNVQFINFPLMFAQNSSSANGTPNPQLPQFGGPMFFGLPMLQPMGNPGDYAIGPQGLDNIISQMLANLEDNGPPPTEKEKIEALPMVQATADELKECTLCSVCKEDFATEESLLKLPCKHLYHKECVIPWLEMHDTCPTCRFHVNTGKYDDGRTTT